MGNIVTIKEIGARYANTVIFSSCGKAKMSLNPDHKFEMIMKSTGPGIVLCGYVHTGLRQDMDQDPLFVSVPFLLPVPVLLPYSPTIQGRIEDFRRRGANPPAGGGGGGATYIFIKISEKLHEIEKYLAGGDTPGAPL